MRIKAIIAALMLMAVTAAGTVGVYAKLKFLHRKCLNPQKRHRKRKLLRRQRSWSRPVIPRKLWKCRSFRGSL